MRNILRPMLGLILAISFINFVDAKGVAAPLESVIDAIGIKTSEDQTYNSWEDAIRIKRVKWQWPYYESGAHDSTMIGKTKIGQSKNPNIGATEIRVEGLTHGISKIHIEIGNEPQFQTVTDLFGKGKLIRIPTSCDIDEASAGDAVYKYIKLGYKPLFVRLEYGWGASGDSGSVDVTVAYTLEDALQGTATVANPCTVLQQ